MNKLQASEVWSQLKKRKVVRVALIYWLVGVLAILIATLAFETLGVPPFVLTVLTIVIFLGFPVALVLGWMYEITPDGIRKDTSSHVESATKFEIYEADAPSIAVLPFEDTSEDSDQTYFCEGFAEEILDALRKIPNLRVASRVAAFGLGVKRPGYEEVATKLKVQTMLKGTCNKTPEKLQVSLQLIDTSDGSLRWSRQYDRPAKDIFDVEEDIENAVLKALKVERPNRPGTERQRVDPKV
ncbi:MAG TPA: hypothetical protein VLA51_10170, partial [Paracoccaceae bacterium]|nr:hypothetical protein [Paracoccaceae bacterium]